MYTFCLLLIFQFSHSLARSADDLDGRVIVGYFPEWGVFARNYHVTNIPADKLTHVHYAFMKPVFNEPEGTAGIEFIDPFAAIEKMYPGDTESDPFHGNLNQLLKLKRQHPHLKTVMAVGGVTYSQLFSDIVATVTSRQSFAESCRDFMVQYGFDGIDIDWEFPVEGGAPDVEHRPEDDENLVLLIETLRQVLDQQETADGRDYLLTMEVSATGPTLDRRYNLPEMIGQLDWVHVMAYAFSGPWAPVTGHHAALYGNPRSPYGDFHAAEPVVHLLNQGISSRKIVLGVPFYGQGFKGVGPTQNGLFQPHDGESDEGTWQPGIFAYHDLRDGTQGHQYIGGGGFEQHWDPAGHASFLYNAQQGIYVTYESPRAIRLKADFVKELDLGGMMCWSLDYDSADHELLGAIHDTLAADNTAGNGNRTIFEFDYDGNAPEWNYSYAYAAFGGNEFEERQVSTNDLPNSWQIAAFPSTGGSNVLLVNGDFTEVPQPGELTEDELLIGYSYSGLGAGNGSQSIAATNLATPALADYGFTFSAGVPAGFVPGESTASGTWKLELQAPDNTVPPPDNNTSADTVIALEAEFAALPSVLTPFTFRLNDAEIVEGSEVLFNLHRTNISQVNINFNFWAVEREFGYDANNQVALDNLKLQFLQSIVPVFLSISENASSGDLVLDWEGDGTLQQSASVDGEFVTMDGAQAPVVVQPDGAAGFFRLISGSQ